MKKLSDLNSIEDYLMKIDQQRKEELLILSTPWKSSMETEPNSALQSTLE